MRDRQYWGSWLRKNAERVRPEIASVRDWYKAAGVTKEERRIFRAALKSAGEKEEPRKAGKFKRRREPAEGAGVPHGAPKGAVSRGTGGPVVEGRLRFTRDGRPLVIPDSEEGPVVRVPGHALGGAWPKDRVVVRLERRRGGAPAYGRIVRVVERGIRTFVGRFVAAGDGHYVRFRDREADLRLPAELADGVKPEPGDLVEAEVSGYPGRDEEGRVRIVDVLGKDYTMETIARAVTAARDIPVEFSAAAKAEAAAIPKTVRCDGKDGGGESAGPLRRVDQRHLPFVTIDGEDARDFDDAVCLVEEGERVRLLVAIADVSHYVPVGSAIDRDAYLRGTSVYFPDRAVPMLPPELSEGVCSLKPGVNRLAMTVDIPISPQGRTGPPSFHPSVIRSRARLTYDEVHEILAGEGGREPKGRITTAVVAMLKKMEALAGRLALARADRGSLDFDLPEAKIVVSAGMPVRVEADPRFESHRLIEEFMLLANTAVAEFLAGRDFPFLFRIHEPPAPDRLEEFEDAAARLLRRTHVTDRRDVASRLQAWAAAARGGKYEKHINMLLLRSLMLARYGPEEKGHFGLALSRYTHFTSPIRRYPDLIVHRVLKAALGDAGSGPYLRMLSDTGAEIGSHLSGRERAAMEAERDVEQRAKALLMSARIGEAFEGVISSVIKAGLFVELADQYVEGFVHSSTLRDDVYRFSEDRAEWYGVLRKRRLSLGDRVLVRVRRADVERGEIDFLFIEKVPESP
ncbi:MAG: ribonuclease R [Deltaproteobacteria bacterium]|nr:ribonuclease R [Deltaproteobacteria bacterium]